MRFKYCAIYECSGIEQTKTKHVVSGVLLEIFSTSKILNVTHDSVVHLPVGTSIQADVIRKLELPNKTHIQLTVSADIVSLDSEDLCIKRLDQAILNISLVSDAFIFRNLVYKGWVVDNYSAMSFSREYVGIKENLNLGDSTRSRWQSITAIQNHDSSVQDRIYRMARYYIKAIARKNDDEKFLYLWTILEIWPMTGTADIRSISDVLSEIIGFPDLFVKNKLSLGTLCKARGDLIHDGYLKISAGDRDEYFMRLEKICRVFLNKLSGIPYYGELDFYFQ